jgi:hypothetical protein
MTLDQVIEVLGQPSSTMAGGDLLARFGSVSGSTQGVSSVAARAFYVWRRPEGQYKLVFQNGVLADVYAAPPN